ncbi:Rho GTPase [Ascosphaera acerosa]|nr:Rho GTPase [Ascosphaera acerosa]
MDLEVARGGSGLRSHVLCPRNIQLDAMGNGRSHVDAASSSSPCAVSQQYSRTTYMTSTSTTYTWNYRYGTQLARRNSTAYERSPTTTRKRSCFAIVWVPVPGPPFAVDSPESLENIEYKWVEEINEHCPRAKIVLVALKCDLREEIDSEKDDSQSSGAAGAADGGAGASATGGAPSGIDPSRIVSYAQGLAMAKKIGALRYLECSAKRNRGVKEAFTEAARVALTVGSQDSGKSCVIL